MLSVMKLAWAWASLSSQLGASASRATTSPNWPESSRRLGKSRTCCSTFWTTPCRTRAYGSTCTSTKNPPTRRRTATGEAKVHPTGGTGSLGLHLSNWCPGFYILVSAAGTSTPWRQPRKTSLRTSTERCCEGRASWKMPLICQKDIATVGLCEVTMFFWTSFDLCLKLGLFDLSTGED